MQPIQLAKHRTIVGVHSWITFDVVLQGLVKLDLGEFINNLRGSVLVAASVRIAERAHESIGQSGLIVGSFYASFGVGAVLYDYRGGAVIRQKGLVLNTVGLMLLCTVGPAILMSRSEKSREVEILCGFQLICGGTSAYYGIFRDVLRKYIYKPVDLSRAMTRRKLYSGLCVKGSLLEVVV